jgi:uncharacterized phiE125 gp8 family phage protein
VADIEIPSEWTLVTGPAQEPVSLSEAKAQARITDDNSNAVLLGYITAAREAAEQYMARGLLTQVWKLTLDGWANVMPLPMAAPLQVATVGGVAYPKVEYYNSAGVLTTLATTVYDSDVVARPGRIVLKPGQSWPSLQGDRLNGRVVITYAVGWASVAAIPELIKLGIRLYITYLDADRDGMEPQAMAALEAARRCWGDRVYWAPPHY